MYSSCKSRLLEEVEKDYHLEVAKKVSSSLSQYFWEYLRISLCVHTLSLYLVQLEIDNGDELTEEFLYDEVHPKQHAFKQAFAKPRGPAGKRGNKRLIKGAGESRLES